MDDRLLLERVASVYAAAARDDATTAEVQSILRRARTLLGDAAHGILGGDAYGDETPADSPGDLGRGYAALRIAEVELHAAVLCLARQHMADGDWWQAAGLAFSLGGEDEVREEAVQLVCDALGAGLSRLLGDTELLGVAWVAAFDRWIARARCLISNDLHEDSNYDELLLRALDGALGRLKNAEGGPTPEDALVPLSLARAYVGTSAGDDDRQAEAGHRLAAFSRTLGPSAAAVVVVRELTLPMVEDIPAFITRLDQIATRHSATWDRWLKLLHAPPAAGHTLAEIDAVYESRRRSMDAASDAMVKLNDDWSETLEGALAHASLRVRPPRDRAIRAESQSVSS